MNKFLKDVFFLMMGVIVAMLLYFAFFGFHLSNDDTFTGRDWEGVMYYAGRAIEHPISRAYYLYCYVPMVNDGNGVDEALGGSPVNSELQKTDTNVSHSSLGNSDNYSFSGATSNANILNYYSTGWQ